MNKAFRYLKRILFILLAIPLLYFLSILIGAAIPVNSDQEEKEAEIEIFLISNGMHIDFVVPLENEIMDWNRVVKPQHTLAPRRNYEYVAFGWGDLEFYEETPRWEDLELGTAFRALFLKSPAAMHAEFLTEIRQESDKIRLEVTHEQYKRLSAYILNSMVLDSNKEAKLIEDLRYNSNDAFYEAKGSLNLFRTCNTWVNNGLKTSGLKAVAWTPVVEGVFFRYGEL